MSEATEASPAAILDPQDPLPESNWIPRRWFAFISLVGLFTIKGFETLLDRQNWLTDVLIFTIIVCYMIAPSAEQATKMIQMASLFRHGVSFKSETRASATPIHQQSESKTEVGLTNGASSNDPAGKARPSQEPNERGADAPFYAGPESEPAHIADAPFFERDEEAGMGKQGQRAVSQ